MSASLRRDTTNEVPVPPVVLVLEDERPVAESLRRSLTSRARTVHLCTTVEEADACLAEHTIDVALVDHVLGGQAEGLAFLRRLHDRREACARVLCTGHTDLQFVVEAINHGKIDGFLPKPWDEAVLTAVVHQGRDVASLRRRNRELRAVIEERNRELTALNQGLEAQVRERTRSLEETNERLRNFQHELVRLESQALLTQLVRGLAHELNNPLAVILGTLERLRRRYRERSEDDLPRRLDILDGEARRCATLVNNLRTYAQPLQERQQTCRMELIVNEAIERLGARDATVPEIRQLEDIPIFSAAPRAMARVVEAILDNAVRAECTLVEISARRQDDRVHVCIANDGRTPTEQEIQQADKPFFSGRNDGSPGLGLSLARSLLGEQGATLVFDRRAAGGAQVTISLQPTEESGELMQRLLAERSQAPVLAVGVDRTIEDQVRRVLSAVQPTAVLRYAATCDEARRLLEDGPCRALIINITTEGNRGSALLQEQLQKDTGLSKRCAILPPMTTAFPALPVLAAEDTALREQLHGFLQQPG